MIKNTWVHQLLLPVLIGLFLVTAYLPALTNYQLSGDDLILITNAPTTLEAGVRKFTDFSNQYRPLTHILFGVYGALLPQTGLILALNFGLLVFVAILTYLNMKRLCDEKIAAALTVCTFLSPIFYYHFYSISSLNNILMLIFGLLLLLLVKLPKDKSIEWKNTHVLIAATVLLVLSVMSKESFFVNAALYGLIIFQRTTRRQMGVLFGGLAAFIGGYLFLRFSSYSSAGEYSVRFSFATMIKSLLDVFAWVLGYPRGWQYGTPEPKSVLTLVTAAVTAASLAMTVIVAGPLKYWKKHLFFGVLLGLSVAPFLIIERVLPFYFDITILVVVFWVLETTRHSSTQLRKIVLILLGLSFVLQYLAYFSQWQKYSFVANANQAVTSYLGVLSQENLQNYPQICIKNHTVGIWGTMDGLSAKYLLGYEGKIVSLPEDMIPEECKMTKSLIIRNDGLEYVKVE